MESIKIQKHVWFGPSKMGFFALIISLLLVQSNVSAIPSIDVGPDTGKLDAFFTSQIAANNLKGMAVIIVRADGTVVYQRGFGMAGKDVPFTPQTPFPISSGSKSFLALSVMQLVDAGKIELDAPIQQYLPWWQVADAKLSAQITVRDLLNHVTGLVAGPGFYDDSGMSYRLPDDTTIEDAVRDLRSARAKKPLRTEVLYFDGNYWTLAALVEEISAQDYPQYLKEKILDPLGMKNTTTTAEGSAGMAQGNLTFFGIPLPYKERINQKYLVGCCGIISTVEDIGHYLIAQLNNGRYRETQLVSLESMRLMHTPPSGIKGSPLVGQYGMGWSVEEEDGITRLDDQGTWATYSSEMTLLLEQGYGIAIFYNQGCIAPYIAGFPTILNDTISLLTGGEPAGGISLKTYGLILACLALLTIGLEIYALARLPRWAEKANDLPVWRKILAVGLPIVEAGLLSFGFPYLVATVTAKTFVLKTALLWWTDLISWFILLSILLLVKAAARLWISIRVSRKSYMRSQERESAKYSVR